jgi:hypothetical protein
MNHKLITHIIRDKRFAVYKINKVRFNERLFCIFDTDKPWELGIDYQELTKSFELSPIIAGKSSGFVVKDKIDLEKKYSFRFETEEECQKHVNEIEQKRKLIDDILENYNKDMIKLYSKSKSLK